VVLPYAEEQTIAGQYDLKKDWFHTDNRTAVSYPLSIFVCPSVPEISRFDVAFTSAIKPAAGDYGCTNGVGAGVWYSHPELGTYPGDINGGEDNPLVIGVLTKTIQRQACRVKDIIDGTSKTMLIAEDAGRPFQYTNGQPGDATGKQIPVGAGTGWADPDSGFTVAHEPLVNYRNDAEIYSFHSGGAHACFADGSTHFVASTLDTVAGIAIITRAGGETVANDAY
jgi:prepilin-type processing-associated H-X9-DG protein